MGGEGVEIEEVFGERGGRVAGGGGRGGQLGGHVQLGTARLQILQE